METMDYSERGTNPVTMTIINPHKEYLYSWDQTKDLIFSSPVYSAKSQAFDWTEKEFSVYIYVTQ